MKPELGYETVCARAGFLEVEWATGMAGPQTLKDLCCSEEQRKVMCVVILSVHGIVECEETRSSGGDNT